MFVGIGGEPYDRWMNLPERSNAEVWLLVNHTRASLGGLYRKD